MFEAPAFRAGASNISVGCCSGLAGSSRSFDETPPVSGFAGLGKSVGFFDTDFFGVFAGPSSSGSDLSVKASPFGCFARLLKNLGLVCHGVTSTVCLLGCWFVGLLATSLLKFAVIFLHPFEDTVNP